LPRWDAAETIDPRIHRVVLPAGRKADGGSTGIAGEGERESDLQPAASGALPSRSNRKAGESAIRRPRIARIGFGVMAFQQEEGEPLPALKKTLIEAAEQRRDALAAELLGFCDGQQLE